MKAQLISGNRIFTPQALSERSARAATGLISLGIGHGDCIAILIRNDSVFFEITEAAAQVGAYVVPINWHFRAEEALHIVADSNARLLIAHADLWPIVSTSWNFDTPVLLCETPAEIVDAYAIQPPEQLADNHVDAIIGEWSSWLSGFEAYSGTILPPGLGLIYTSGTTGKPKGVRRAAADESMRAKMASLMGQALGLVPGEVIRTAITGPIYHAAPNTYAIVASQIGELIVLQPRFDAEELLQLIERHSLTHLHMVPTMFVRLCKLPEKIRNKYDLSSLKFVAHGAAPCAPSIKQEMIKWWGPVIHEYYGGTETGGAVCHNSEEALLKPGTVGKAMPGCHIKIAGAGGESLPSNEIGEVYIRNDSFPKFTYHNRDEGLTDAHRDDGYVTLGDVGYLDDDGYLFLCDRAKDMVISGGVNIYPSEIEAVLLEMPGVKDCAVFGIPDDEFGEALCAVIEPEPECPPNTDEIRAFVRRRLAGFKVPRVVEFSDNLPREDSGKIYKRLLRAPYWEAAGRAI